MNAVVSAQSARNSGWIQNFSWLVKRELWEHRALYIAPLVFAAVILIGTVVAIFKVGHIQVANIDFNGSREHIPDGVRLIVYMLFSIPFAMITAVVATYYALDALYAERRDRSVLFWKSLPVSDWETVVSKLAVASLVAPAIGIAISVVTQLVVFTVVSVMLAVKGESFMYLWSQIPFLENIAILLYMFIVQALWYLPLVAWCLLASAWARRAVFLWAAVPIGAAALLESQMLGTHLFGDLLRIRVSGAFELATGINKEFVEGEGLAQGAALHVTDIMTPGVFFSSAQLWGGLIVAAGLIAATVWVRRYREAT